MHPLDPSLEALELQTGMLALTGQLPFEGTTLGDNPAEMAEAFVTQRARPGAAETGDLLTTEDGADGLGVLQVPTSGAGGLLAVAARRVGAPDQSAAHVRPGAVSYTCPECGSTKVSVGGVSPEGASTATCKLCGCLWTAYAAPGGLALNWGGLAESGVRALPPIGGQYHLDTQGVGQGIGRLGQLERTINLPPHRRQ